AHPHASRVRSQAHPHASRVRSQGGNMFKKLILGIFVASVISAIASAKGDDAPAWLKQAAAASVPAYDKKVQAVVLVNEERKTIEEDGRIRTVTQRAVRILAREGRREAVARASYSTDTDKVKEMRAWLIRPSGEVTSYGKKETMDLAMADNDVYNEVRVKLISAAENADAGCVFGYEIVTEEKSVFSQFVWHFQEDIPVVASRITIALPKDWRAGAVMFNHAKIEPAVNGTTWAWELRNLPQIEDEPAAPEMTNLAARIAISVYPPDGKATNLRTFASWKDVSRYKSELSDPQAGYNDAIAAKARELTVNARTEYEKIQAVGRYAQSVNYISIQTGVGRGGGYRPHPAADVFGKNYGDCKDKANLMRAMLKSLNIESYPVSIFSGDPTYVRSEWPSPHQFNHAILAVKVGDETKAASVVKHPQLGRLLVFDPTDEDTPVGDLPDHEQGSFALIAAGEQGELMRMPVTEPEANKLDRSIEAELNAQGILTAKVQERFIGQSAVTSRREFKRLAKPDYIKMIEKWVTRTVPSAAVTKVEPADDQAGGKFALDVEFNSASYAQTMRGNLIVFKPAIVGRRSSLLLTEAKRQHPVVLESQAYSETVRVKLPAGFDVDEIPDAAEMNQPFGNYAAKFEVKDGHLVFRRTLVLKSSQIPVEQYAAVRSFFQRIYAVEQAPVVLAKK
ncbi:MAG: DUF3857 domain-containing protein, partial [Blastocatellia bacterium]